MDEEEKLFPIEFIVILLLVAIANDIAEVCFDLLDLTGVGFAGEGIMEPINLILDFFFTGIFWWKVGPGGGTITQYIDDVLEPLLIPGRTISVGLGMWIANHPGSVIGKIANTATSLEKGNVSGALSEAEGGAAKMQGAVNTEKGLQGEARGIGGGDSETATRPDQQELPENKTGSGEGEETGGNDIFKNPLANPVGTAGEEAFNPTEDQVREENDFKAAESQEELESAEMRKKREFTNRSAKVFQDIVNNEGKKEKAA